MFFVNLNTTLILPQVNLFISLRTTQTKYEFSHCLCLTFSQLHVCPKTSILLFKTLLYLYDQVSESTIDFQACPFLLNINAKKRDADQILFMMFNPNEFALDFEPI